MNALLNVDKPAGLTSHDVVERIRAASGVRRVGHAGTLDPLATGVLVVCLGKATRLAEYLMRRPKTYRAVVRFGVSTDSYDAAGRVLRTAPFDLDEDRVAAALKAFRGTISQVPPAYSALKRDGRPLYELARRGIDVERRARQVEIEELVMESWTPPDLALRVTCSAGTYIRSLAHDLGERLGPGAHLAHLVRTASGRFRIEAAASLAAVESAAREGRLGALLVSMREAMAGFPEVELSAREVDDVACGRPLERPVEAPGDGLCCACDAHGALVALLRFDAALGRWRPHKVLLES